ncbi:SGNH/GDSL hydrolase family protein [Mesorhizobium sp.]|uniref:SGNH/GDSL hydrolase family protein n=1 Tax=Mesorhizobium sp. TaxID=1871066 RepID=UPI000FEA729B|nr:SGNH/GDSL hydrolase family protein [Mesorhizobium sp.]RWE79572.1 MAG: SGNH/GDSL hydrolase family protein [Mesorhizobium sp.]
MLKRRDRTCLSNGHERDYDQYQRAMPGGHLMIGKRAAGLAVAGIILLSGFGSVSARDVKSSDWVPTWSSSAQAAWGAEFPIPTGIPAGLRNQTVRQYARISVGGNAARVVLSNEYGKSPLVIAHAHIALVSEDNKNVAGTDTILTFGGNTDVVLQPGATAVSDRVKLSLKALDHVQVSIFLPNETELSTFHWVAKQATEIGAGDQTTAATISDPQTIMSRVFLTEILVSLPSQNGAIVAFGDSITDGDGSSANKNLRWPDLLAERLATRQIAVVNEGISGDRLLTDLVGTNGVARFQRDVLQKSNVRAAFFMMGINDIGQPGLFIAPNDPPRSSKDIISGYRQVISQAHVHGIRIVGSTLTPFDGALSGTPLKGYYNASKEVVRNEVNDWIRNSKEFDAVVDFDSLLRDPSSPTKIRAEFDSGDHLHPNDAGYKAMANFINIDDLIGKH